MSIQQDPHSVSPGGASSTDQLTLTAERGTGMNTRENGFLKHPEVGYDYNENSRPSRLTLTAQNNRGEDVAMAILAEPSAQQLVKQGYVELVRFAAHPDRPENTGSWLLSRACEWARLEGYDTMITYAGIANENTGTMYDATGFTHDYTNENADTSGWTNRDNRNTNTEYTRRRWSKNIGPGQDFGYRRYEERDNWALSGFVGTDEDEEVSVSDLVLTREEELSGGSFVECATEARNQISESAVRWDDIAAIFGMRHESTGELLGYIAVEDATKEGRDSMSVRVSDLGVEQDTVKYPVQALRWLLGRVRRWASLHGHSRMEITPLRHEWEEVYAGADFKNIGTCYVTLLG